VVSAGLNIDQEAVYRGDTVDMVLKMARALHNLPCIESGRVCDDW